MSREFAEDTACVLAAARHPRRTSFARAGADAARRVRGDARSARAAGVMVTASHNPPEYNGYKVYWGNGAQIIPPHDAGIAARDRAAPAAQRRRRGPTLADARGRKGLVSTLDETLARRLPRRRATRSRVRPGDGDRRIAHRLHAAARRRRRARARARSRAAGFTDVHDRARAAEPDGAFPTVAFPNPEEKGAMDLALALARKTSAELVLANDPDADRLAVARARRRAGEYAQLTGNQVGVLLGALPPHRAAARPATRAVAIASIVSSPLLGVIARALGVRYDETLTGFKWIANRAMELERERRRAFVFGYEEALGYTSATSCATRTASAPR